MLTGLSREDRKHKLRQMRTILQAHGVRKISNDPFRREMQFRRLVAQLGYELVPNDQGRLELQIK